MWLKIDNARLKLKGTKFMIHKAGFFSMLICCSFLLSGSTSAASKTPLKSVTNYKIYYGPSNQEIVEQLGTYDLVIIEPHEFTREQVEEINKQGTITLGYMSIMELEKWNEDFVKKVKTTDYYYSKKKKVYIQKWDTYLMDISNKHYQGILLEEIQMEILEKGFEGIFLDTAGDIDDFFLKKPKELEKLRKGYIQLLKEIHSENKSLLLVQNWGFETYKAASKSYVDGVLWENFDKKRLQKDDWSQKWIKYFKNADSKGNLSVFTVAPNSTGKKYSESHGFTSYINKNSIYNHWNIE